jgi:hypothetical protein
MEFYQHFYDVYSLTFNQKLSNFCQLSFRKNLKNSKNLMKEFGKIK